MFNFAPSPSSLFTGQESYIQELRSHFWPRIGDTLIKDQKRYVLHGMGGIGKTQICLKFIQVVSQL